MKKHLTLTVITVITVILAVILVSCSSFPKPSPDKPTLLVLMTEIEIDSDNPPKRISQPVISLFLSDDIFEKVSLKSRLNYLSGLTPGNYDAICLKLYSSSEKSYNYTVARYKGSPLDLEENCLTIFPDKLIQTRKTNEEGNLSMSYRFEPLTEEDKAFIEAELAGNENALLWKRH